jgi:hypothetical protein
MRELYITAADIKRRNMEWLRNVIRMDQKWWSRNFLKVTHMVEEMWEGQDLDERCTECRTRPTYLKNCTYKQ